MYRSSFKRSGGGAVRGLRSAFEDPADSRAAGERDRWQAHQGHSREARRRLVSVGVSRWISERNARPLSRVDLARRRRAGRVARRASFLQRELLCAEYSFVWIVLQRTRQALEVGPRLDQPHVG